MNKSLFKIVLTGGPCAGKTTAFSKIEEDLTEKGYQVFVVSESATELIKGGIRPFGNNSFDFLEFQNLILQYQLGKEKIYENAAMSIPNNKKCVILYDRGVMDNKAYLDQQKFIELLNRYQLNELSLLDNYDMVIHLVTAADGKEEYYTLSNNTARSETAEEARMLDKKTINAWAGHNNLKIIDNSTGFEEKLNKVTDAISNLLGHPISIRQQRKYRIDLSNSNLDFLKTNNCSKIKIEQTYLVNMGPYDGYEERLRKRTYQNKNSYYYTIQKHESDGFSKIVTDRKITEAEYFTRMDMCEAKNTIKKIRYSFALNKQYFKLDVFDEEELVILEIEPTIENQTIHIPDDLYVIEEVTNDFKYKNYNLADNKQKQKCLVRKSC
ncbi:MAG: AAA family ATPase [Bacilli bacterium]|nr:AAA family ATPase [Bacilli bacterium]MDD3304782.1 AAA family ATPase [Bacilli bacterium]MDD4053804.1 AAA family ATPase [Bacilli bacterium]MDD4411622.1 AAA family ATPase [Bacilli bacterium]